MKKIYGRSDRDNKYMNGGEEKNCATTIRWQQVERHITPSRITSGT